MSIETKTFDYKQFFSLPRCAGSWVNHGSGCLLTAFWYGLGYSLEEQSKTLSTKTVFHKDGSITFDGATPYDNYPVRDRLIFETDVLAAKVLGDRYPNGFPVQIETCAPTDLSETVEGVYCPISDQPSEFTDAIVNNFDYGNVSLAYDLMAELIQSVWGVNLLETEKIDELVCQAI